MSIKLSRNVTFSTLLLALFLSQQSIADTNLHRLDKRMLDASLLHFASFSSDRDQNRRSRSNPYHGERHHGSHYQQRYRQQYPDRRDYYQSSYTSPPIRGGSSRRTRIVENPYSDRLVTGITLTGIDNRPVHIRDVVGYPGRFLLSPLGYSLSLYEHPRFINARHYIDYISVAAKRKEYFTVTFHYD